MKELLIDDVRINGFEGCGIARTFEEGLMYLQYFGPWDILYLDHDLGQDIGNENHNKTGYGILCWLEENTQYLPKDRICLVTSNASVYRKMKLVIDRLYR